MEERRIPTEMMETANRATRREKHNLSRRLFPPRSYIAQPEALRGRRLLIGVNASLSAEDGHLTSVDDVRLSLSRSVLLLTA